MHTATDEELICTLSQAKYHALARGLEIALKFNPTTIDLRDSALIADATVTRVSGIRETVGRVVANYKDLLAQTVDLALAPDVPAIKTLKLIRGAGDVEISFCPDRAAYHFQGDHLDAWAPRASAPSLPDTIPPITWQGNPVNGYDSASVKAFLGKKASKVQLAVYDGLIEQIGTVEGSIYTFTPGMVAQLKNRRPDVVLLSEVAFRFFGKKQSIQIGLAGQEYILKVVNSLDIGVDLVIYEHLAQI